MYRLYREKHYEKRIRPHDICWKAYRFTSMVSQRPKSLSISDGEQNRSRGGNMQGVTSIFFLVPWTSAKMVSRTIIMNLNSHLLTMLCFCCWRTGLLLSCVPVFACRILIRNNFTFCNFEFDNESLIKCQNYIFFLGDFAALFDNLSDHF